MKEVWISSALALWLVLMFVFVRRRFGRSLAHWSRAIAFRPTSYVTPYQLAGYLLSANMALLEHDDFNQLGSALSPKRARGVLARYWHVASALEFETTLEHRLKWRGIGSPDERSAMEAWRESRFEPTEAYAALDSICKFLSVHADVVGPRELAERHMNLAAWDIQQLAYLVRLGVTTRYLGAERAETLLNVLQDEARLHYQSWKDYSLSALIGMGLRSPVDLEDVGDWHHIVRSHTILLNAAETPILHARPWGVHVPPEEKRVRTRRPMDLGPATTSFDTLM